jgi:uroporphyrinogen decarboxylase
MTPKERVLIALERKQPDRVPVGEFVIDPKVVTGFNKGYKDVVDLAFGEGLDCVGAVANFKTVKTLPDGSYIDEWGCTYKPSADYVAHPIAGPIATSKDLDNYQFPDPIAPHRLGGLEKLVEKAKGKIAINFHSRVEFMWSVFLMGMDNLLVAMALEPDFTHRLFEKMADVNIAVIRRAIRAGANTISLGDDYCANKGPLMSPAIFREFCLPHMKRAVAAINDEGAKCIKHCDGNIWPLLDMWVEAGIDCINPLEPVANMDIAEVKAKYGKRIAIMGNIDCADLLCYGTKEQIETAVKECIRKGAPGGGLIISSSNSIHHGIPAKNYAAMISAVHKYGSYPIK